MFDSLRSEQIKMFGVDTMDKYLLTTYKTKLIESDTPDKVGF